MGLIQDLLSAKENFFCSKIRGAKARQLKKIADEHEYRGRLGVGKFQSITCCPKQLVADAQEGRRFATKTGYKLDLGKEIHRSYQQAALETPGLLWDKPNLPKGVYITSPDEDPVPLKQKLEDKWPEVPVFLLDSKGDVAILGYADIVMNKYEKPVVTDIKTVNNDPNDYKYKFAEECKLPDKKHILQCKIYAYLMNLHKYYDQPIKSVVIPYINTRMESGDDAAENELTFPYTEEDASMIGKMLEEGVRQVEAFRKGIELPCDYLHCKKHGPDSKEEGGK